MKDRNVICFACKHEFSLLENADDGYATICTCPSCNAKNSVR